MRWVTRFILLLLVVNGAVAGLAVANGSPNDGGQGPGYTYGELSERGETISADPSQRYLGYSGTVYVSYAETNFFRELGQDDPEYAVDKVIDPNNVVDTREVTMHFNRVRGADSETIHVHVAMWEEKTRRVSENSTERETYAANVTESVKEVELTGANGPQTIGLPKTDDKKMVTMWVEEYPEARWVFEYEPIATSESLPFGTTWSSFLPWFGSRFFAIVAIGVPVAIGGAFKTLDITGAPPGKGAAWWVIVGGLVMYMAGYFALGNVAQLIVTVPYVMGALLVVLAYVATLEYGDQTRSVLVERITTEKVENPLGDEVPDIVHEKGELYHIVDIDGTEEVGIVKKGSLRHFLVVFLGAELPKLKMSDLETRFRYGGVADEKLYADQTEDGELLEITWPALSWSVSNLKTTVEERVDEPDPLAADGGTNVDVDAVSRTEKKEVWDRDKLGNFAMTFGIGTLLATTATQSLLIGASVGVIPAALRVAERVDGDAQFVPAPAHSTPAKAIRIAEQQQFTLGRTFGQLEEKIADMEADAQEKALDIAESYIDQSRNRLDRLLGGGDYDTAMGDRDVRKEFADD